MQDAARSGTVHTIGPRTQISETEQLRRCGSEQLRNEYGYARATDASSAVLRAGIAGSTARVLDAIVGNDGGEQICALNSKQRQPYGEDKPNHVPTIPCGLPEGSNRLRMGRVGFVNGLRQTLTQPRARFVIAPCPSGSPKPRSSVITLIHLSSPAATERSVDIDHREPLRC